MWIDVTCNSCRGLGYLTSLPDEPQYLEICWGCYGTGIESIEINWDPNNLLREICNEDE